MTTETSNLADREWQSWETGHDTLNQVISDLRDLADRLEHYRDAYDRAMRTHDKAAAKDHLQATNRVLAELVQASSNRITAAIEITKGNAA